MTCLLHVTIEGERDLKVLDSLAGLLLVPSFSASWRKYQVELWEFEVIMGNPSRDIKIMGLSK